MLKRIGRSDAVQALLARTVALYLALVLRTTRWHVEGLERLAPAARQGNALVGFWHEMLPLMPVLFRIARRYNRGLRVTALASRHRDGRLLGGILHALGIGTAFGSSGSEGRERGGAAGALALLELLQRGEAAAITPDGPRGPRRRAKPGVAQLAALSGLPLMPLGVQVRWHCRLRTWDHLILPFPFSRGALVCGPPIAVPRENWEDSLPALEAAMTAAAERAEALCR
jgi:lysophospholipid acyltransferase (LPLAT)-like uncharacterized protein